MPYIGKNPVGGGFHKLDALTASATDTYALTLGSAAYYPESANQLLVSLNGVIQAPQDSFTVSGSNLVFDTALTASDSIDFVVALGDVLAVQTVTDGAITTAKLGNGAVTDAKIDTMAASKLTGALPAIDGSALTGIGTGHAFSARIGAAFAVSASTFTKVQFNTEDFDVDNEFDTTTYRFTPTVAGYYQFNASAAVSSYVTQMQLAFYKNGAVDKNCINVTGGGQVPASGLIYLNGSTDYVEVYVWISGAQNIGAGFFDGFLARAS
jgi:hypothetical protein